jgi:hypothetical protein
MILKAVTLNEYAANGLYTMAILVVKTSFEKSVIMQPLPCFIPIPIIILLLLDLGAEQEQKIK